MRDDPRSDWQTLAGVLLVADGVGGVLLAVVVFLGTLFLAGTPRSGPFDQTPAVLAILGLLALGVIALTAAVFVLRERRVGRIPGIAVGLLVAAVMVAVLVSGVALSAYEIVLGLAILAIQVAIVVPLASWRG